MAFTPTIGAQQDLSYMDDRALQTAMQFAQRSNDTPTFLALSAEANKRKKMRAEAQGMQAGQQLAQGPRTQADAVMSGIANLAAPSDEQGYAGGGIVSFSGGGGTDYNSEEYQQRLQAAIDEQRRALLPQQSLPFEYRIGSENYPSWLKTLTGTPEWFRKGAGRGASGATAAQNKERSNAPVINRDAPDVPYVPTSEDREGRRTGPQASLDKNQEPRLGPAGGSTSARVSAKTVAASAAPAPAAAEATPEWMKVPKARELDEIIADRKKAAAEGEAGIKALMDPYTAKLEARRKALEGETADKEGLLGLKWGDDKRKALRDFGLAMMSGKDANWMVNAGAAGKAAAEAYDKGKEARQARMDALDERDQKLAMARFEMQRGNRDEAARLVKEADEAGQTAFSNRFNVGKFGAEEKGRAEERAFRERQLKQQYDLGIQQIAASRDGHAQSDPLRLYRELGGGDVKKGYEYAKKVGAEGATDKALMTQLLKDPELKTANPALYNYIVAQLYGSGPGAVTTKPTGKVIN